MPSASRGSAANVSRLRTDRALNGGVVGDVSRRDFGLVEVAEVAGDLLPAHQLGEWTAGLVGDAANEAIGALHAEPRHGGGPHTPVEGHVREGPHFDIGLAVAGSDVGEVVSQVELRGGETVHTGDRQAQRPAAREGASRGRRAEGIDEQELGPHLVSPR